MGKDNKPPHKHRHIAIKHGHATFYGDAEPSKELLEALNRMAELVYKQSGSLKINIEDNSDNCRPLCIGK